MTSTRRDSGLEQGLLSSDDSSDSHIRLDNREKSYNAVNGNGSAARWRHDLTRTWRRLPAIKRSRLVILISITLLSFLGMVMWKKDVNPIEKIRQTVGTNPRPAAVRYEKPLDVKIVGLVFYGRRDRVEILDCYLKRNLVANGGWLDEVVWAINTEDQMDLAYLDDLVLTSEGYRKLEIQDKNYLGIWEASMERGILYVKIDDDVVYIDDDTIPMIVRTKINRPDALFVSAAMINSPELNWIHYRSGAVHPYLPELAKTADGDLSTYENPMWRASDLPKWDGSADWEAAGVSNDDFNKIWQSADESQADTDNAEQKRDDAHEFITKHRWLPTGNRSDLWRTPISQAEYDAFGNGWSSWALAAQQHYSLLQNLEEDKKHLYYLNHGFGDDADALWDTTKHRLSINLLAVMGEDVLDHMDGMGDDEEWLSNALPVLLHRRALVHTQALAAHYAFYIQGDIDRTDILDRYRAYAMENVCPGSFIHANY